MNKMIGKTQNKEMINLMNLVDDLEAKIYSLEQKTHIINCRLVNLESTIAKVGKVLSAVEE
jgi:chaperonin cofactor prefoldin